MSVKNKTTSTCKTAPKADVLTSSHSPTMVACFDKTNNKGVLDSMVIDDDDVNVQPQYVSADYKKLKQA